MIEISDEAFEAKIGEALASLPGDHIKRIQNVAITWQHDPSPEQRQQLQLRHDQTLFGLYEGVPLSNRQGGLKLLPDKITIFKNPICNAVQSVQQLQEELRHTLWHEIAHYYGLNHDQIGNLE